MEARQFYKEWLRRAFVGKLLLAEGISGVAMLAAIPVGVFWQPPGGIMNWMPLAVFGAVFLGTVIIGLIIAPHLIQKEISDDRDSLKKKFDSADQIHAIVAKLRRFRRRGVRIRNMAITTNQYRKWKKVVDAWSNLVISATQELSDVEADFLTTLNWVHDWPVPNPLTDTYNKENRFISERLDRIEDVIRRWSVKERILLQGK